MSKNMHYTFVALNAIALFGFINAQSMGSRDLLRCRQNCYEKFVHDWHHCMDFEDCKNMCITPPNINSYIPEAFSFLCWNNCDQQLGPFPLNINSALRQESLVLTDIGWDQAITNASRQCLVTWEVSGGGLMGNLLTDSSSVELSLWPDTVYHVQVTCKHKETGGMRRSYKLIVDTHKLSDSTATGMQAIAMETPFSKSMSNMYGNAAAAAAAAQAHEQSNSAEVDSRLRILKDSSKDFLTPYNPNAGKTKDKSVENEIAQKLAATEQHSHQDNTASPLNTVTRVKLVGTHDIPAIPQVVLLALVASAIFFVGILLLFVVTRAIRKNVPEGASAIDKEVLIHTEITPASLAQRKARSSVTHTATIAVSDNRTLHV